MALSKCRFLTAKKWSPQIYEVPLTDLPDESTDTVAEPIPLAEPMTVDEEEEPTPTNVYEVKTILDHKWRNGWKFQVWWEGFPADQATWEPPKNFVLTNGAVNIQFRDYCLQKGLEPVLRRTLGSQSDM